MKIFDIFSDLTEAELANLDRADRAALIAEAEVARIAEVKALGHVPGDAGPEIPEAPARGPVRQVEMRSFYPKGNDGFESKPAGFLGRKTLHRADRFDEMAARAAQQRRPAPFSPGQVAMGRFYRDLVERHACAGVRCSSIEGLSQGDGSGGDFLDAVLRDRARIEILRQRIGVGSAMVIRRHRPSSRGARTDIPDRRLVDIVCLEDGSISDVLKEHRWTVNSALVTSLQRALADALDRMMGPVRGRGRSVAHFGAEGLPVWE